MKVADIESSHSKSPISKFCLY